MLNASCYNELSFEYYDSWITSWSWFTTAIKKSQTINIQKWDVHKKEHTITTSQNNNNNNNYMIEKIPIKQKFI